jgi:hypothetical protein
VQLSIGYLSFFDRLTTTWERVGHQAKIHEELAGLFPTCRELQNYMCEYLVVVINFSTKVAIMLAKSRLSKLASSFAATFEVEFKKLDGDLAAWSECINRKTFALQIGSSNRSSMILSTFHHGFREAEVNRRKLELIKALSPEQSEFDSIWRREAKRGHTRWILNNPNYQSWKSSPASTCLFVTGSLGSGKTVLAANIIRELYQDFDNSHKKPNISSFFCQYKRRSTLKAKIVLGSILHQILRNDNSSFAKLSLTDTSSFSETICDIPAFLSNLPFQLPVNRQYFVVVDGLDECVADESELIVSCLVDLSEAVPLHILLSFRVGYRVPSETSLLNVNSISMSNTEKDEDISEFVEREFLRRGGLSHIGKGIEERAKEVLISFARGMFLWVRLQLDFLMPPAGQSSVSAQDVISLLEKIPLDLPSAFDRAMGRINDQRYDSKIFQLVAASERPLRTEELQIALNILPGDRTWNPLSLSSDAQALVWDCGGGLLEIDEADETVHFIHHSALLHLLNGIDNQFCPLAPANSLDRFKFSMGDADALMATTCVVYLSLDVHDQRLQKKQREIPADAVIDTVAGSGSSGTPVQQVLSRFAVHSLRSSRQRGSSPHDVQRTLASFVYESVAQRDLPLRFLDYAKDHWISHTKNFWPTSQTHASLDEHRFGTLVADLVTKAPYISKPWLNDPLVWALSESHVAIFEAVCREGGEKITSGQIAHHLHTTSKVPRTPGFSSRVLGKICSASIIEGTPLCDHYEDFRDLIKGGADPDLPIEFQSSQTTLLFLVVRDFDQCPQKDSAWEIFHQLLAFGADPTAGAVSVVTLPLYLAISQQNHLLADGLLNQMMKRGLLDPRCTILKGERGLISLVFKNLVRSMPSIRGHDINTPPSDFIVKLLRAGVVPDGEVDLPVPRKRRSLLLAALACGYVNVAEMILETIQPLSYINEAYDGITPAGLAAEIAHRGFGQDWSLSSRAKLITSLVAAGADFWTPSITPSDARQLAPMARLLDPVNVPISLKNLIRALLPAILQATAAALHRTPRVAYSDAVYYVVQRVIELGEDPNLPFQFRGETAQLLPLVIRLAPTAGLFGRELTSLLLEAGAQCNSQDLASAYQSGDWQAIKYCIFRAQYPHQPSGLIPLRFASSGRTLLHSTWLYSPLKTRKHIKISPPSKPILPSHHRLASAVANSAVLNLLTGFRSRWDLCHYKFEPDCEISTWATNTLRSLCEDLDRAEDIMAFCQSRYPEPAISFLLDCGADIRKLPPTSPWRSLPLLKAIAFGTESEIEWLLTAKDPVEIDLISPPAISLTSVHGHMLLLHRHRPVELAQKLGRKSVVALLRNLGATNYCRDTAVGGDVETLKRIYTETEVHDIRIYPQT